MRIIGTLGSLPTQKHTENKQHSANKTFSSDRKEAGISKDHGWVEKEYVAKEKGLLNWKTDQVEKTKLEHYLGEMRQNLTQREQLSATPQLACITSSVIMKQLQHPRPRGCVSRKRLTWGRTRSRNV